jgi:RNA polymerase sigma-70 factor (family 1)
MSIKVDTEKVLLDIKAGNQEAFTSVFNHYFTRMTRFARTYVLDDAVARNLTQDAFMKLWENRKSIRDGSSTISYLLTIVKNNCLDYLKHLQIEHKYSQTIKRSITELELNYQALKRLEVDLLDYNEIEQTIQTTLESLPPQCRKVFMMSRFEDLSNSEISEKMGITVKAVEANITRALKVFRVLLKDYLVVLMFLDITIH